MQRRGHLELGTWGLDTDFGVHSPLKAGLKHSPLKAILPKQKNKKG